MRGEHMCENILLSPWFSSMFQTIVKIKLMQAAIITILTLAI